MYVDELPCSAFQSLFIYEHARELGDGKQIYVEVFISYDFLPDPAKFKANKKSVINREYSNLDLSFTFYHKKIAKEQKKDSIYSMVNKAACKLSELSTSKKVNLIR